MRIGLFTDSYPPYINGVSTSVATLKRALEKKGHIVYVVTVSNNALKYEYDKKERIVKVPGIPIGIYDYRLSRIYPLSMINTMKAWNLDVIHSHTEFGIGILARLFAKQFNIPLVHTYHTLYEDYTHYITHGYFEKSSKKIVEYLTKFYCDKTATELIVTTNKIYKLFREKYKFEKNIHIVPTGMEVEKFFEENVGKKDVDRLKKKLGIERKDFVIIFVGRLASEKNVEFLINSHAKLIKNIKNIKLLIVGDGPDKDSYEALAKKLGLQDSIIFNGKASWEEMPIYYHCADLFTTASTTETQGLTVLEAMASSIVPLCIEDEAFLSTITDGLNGVIFKDEEEYCSDVIKLYKDTQLRKRISSQARIQAEHCSSKTFAERVLEVYERAIIDKQKEDRFGIISKISKKIRGN